MSVPVLLPQLRGAYGLDLATAGLLLSVLWLVESVCQLPSASSRIDWEGEHAYRQRLYTCISLLLVVGTGSVGVLFIAIGIFGVGISLQSMGRYTALVDIHPDQIGAATGVSLAAADAGQSLLSPLAGIVAV